MKIDHDQKELSDAECEEFEDGRVAGWESTRELSYQERRLLVDKSRWLRARNAPVDRYPCPRPLKKLLEARRHRPNPPPNSEALICGFFEGLAESLESLSESPILDEPKLPPVENRIILDLCGGTGSWARPYREAGYDVRLVTLPDSDVRLLRAMEGVHGVLAAPPCTYFCRMRMCQGRPTDDQFRDGLSVVDACLRVISVSKPQWWALENPQGYLRQWLGDPVFKFDPCDFGDPWTKRTWLWGDFRQPAFNFVEPIDSWIRKHAPAGSPKKQTGLARTATERSMTPGGFARAFFQANP